MEDSESNRSLLLSPQASPHWHIATLSIISLLTVVILANPIWEDAFITARYLQNAIELGELVYNHKERVYGFTSALHVLISLPIALIIPSEPAITSLRIVGMSAFLGSTFLIFSLLQLILRRLNQYSARWCLLATVIFVLDFPMVHSAIAGLESLLAVFLMLLALWLTMRKPTHWSNGVAWGLMVLTRPDMVFPVTVLFFNSLLIDRNAALKQAAVSLLFYSPWFFFTLSYYGDFVPHSIHAKLHYIRPSGNFLAYLDMTKAFFTHVLGHNYNLGSINILTASTMSILGATGYWQYRKERIVRLIGCLLLSYAFFLIALQGGQHSWYFVVPRALFFLLALLGVNYVFQVYMRSSSSLKILLAALLLSFQLFFLLLGTYNVGNVQKYYEHGVRKKVGCYLSNLVGANESVFTESLGYIGYYSASRMLDYPGIVSPAIVELLRIPLNNEGWFGAIIEHFRPEYLVLREREVSAIIESHPMLLQNNYEHIETFGMPQEAPAYLFNNKGYARYTIWTKLCTPVLLADPKLAVGQKSVSLNSSPTQIFLDMNQRSSKSPALVCGAQQRICSP
jgi:hypothetical protein